jgi:hypothetical protein
MMYGINGLNKTRGAKMVNVIFDSVMATKRKQFVVHELDEIWIACSIFEGHSATNMDINERVCMKVVV